MASITKRGNGYRIKVSCGYDINGKQIVKSMTWEPKVSMTARQIEKELQRQATVFEEKCRSGQFIDSSIKFAKFADIWLKEYAEKQLKAKTIAGYNDILKRVNLDIGHIYLDKIQTVHLLSFYDNLREEGIRKDIKYKSKTDLTPIILKEYGTKVEFAEKSEIAIITLSNACKGKNVSQSTAEKISDALKLKINDIFEADAEKVCLSEKTIQHYHQLISSILQTAVHWQVLFSNPCESIKNPKAKRKESTYLEDTEVMQLLNSFQNEPLK